MMTPIIGLNPFLDRQRDPDGGLTHWEITDAELLRRVRDNWAERRPGYRDGCVLVPIDPTGFKAALRVLQEGDELHGFYEARRAGETPRKSVRYLSPRPVAEMKSRPLSVDVVLYSKATLAEGGDITESDWDVIAVLGKFCPEGVEQPMDPETLMANHFGDSGGSATRMTPEQFEVALRASYEYWRNKALLGSAG